MQKIATADLRVGMKTAKDILSADGRMLLARDTVLTDGYIARLHTLGVAALYVQNPYLQDIEVPELVQDETRCLAMQAVKNCFASLRQRNVLSTAEVRQAADQIVAEVMEKGDVLVHLTDIRVHDDYTFAHSVNVAILTSLTVLHMGYGEGDVRTATLGALLHDVGKMRIPVEVLGKPSALTTEEMELMRQHAELGFDILRKAGGIPLLAAHVALQHHEKNDGSGYPRGLEGETIHPFARVVSVADVYDAVTSDRPYRLGMPAAKAYELLQALANSHFDADILGEFFAHLATYPVGSFVLLSSGATGVVVSVPPKLPCRPTVRLVAAGAAPDGLVDLTKDLTTYIVRLLTTEEINALPLNPCSQEV